MPTSSLFWSGGGGGDGEDVHVPVHRQHCQDGWSKEVRPINQPEEENSTYNSLLVDKVQSNHDNQSEKKKLGMFHISLKDKKRRGKGWDSGSRSSAQVFVEILRTSFL